MEKMLRIKYSWDPKRKSTHTEINLRWQKTYQYVYMQVCFKYINACNHTCSLFQHLTNEVGHELLKQLPLLFQGQFCFPEQHVTEISCSTFKATVVKTNCMFGFNYETLMSHSPHAAFTQGKKVLEASSTTKKIQRESEFKHLK